jgi:hypothetical protein
MAFTALVTEEAGVAKQLATSESKHTIHVWKLTYDAWCTEYIESFCLKLAHATESCCIISQCTSVDDNGIVAHLLTNSNH